MRSNASRKNGLRSSVSLKHSTALVEILLLVAIDLRHRVDELRLALGVRLELGDGVQRLDHLRPVRGRLVERRAACAGAGGSSAGSPAPLRGLDGLDRVLVLLGPRCRRSRPGDLEPLRRLDDVVEDLPLVGADLLPVLELRVERDQGVERRAVCRIDRERLLEVVDGLLGLPLLLLDAAELVVDGRARFGLRPRRGSSAPSGSS